MITICRFGQQIRCDLPILTSPIYPVYLKVPRTSTGKDCMSIAIAPSILSADFARLGEQVAEVERAGADRIHVDVMDGHFVPNLTMGPAIVQSLRSVTRLPLEIHLMVTDPGKFVDQFAAAGANSLIAHLEVLPDPKAWIDRTRERGCRACIAIKPDLPVERAEALLGSIDLMLCMTVMPGFSGQAFMPESPQRIRRLRGMIDRLNPRCELEVDGGIDLETAPVSVAAGANVLVAATAIFRAKNGPAAAVEAMRRSIKP
jgi:ribulose-phosphate 3-epimerase